MFYKVVYLTGTNRRISSFVSGKLTVEYKVGEWACAPEFAARKGYHPLVYSSVTAAIHNKVITDFSNMEVWECEIEDVVDPIPPWGILNILSSENAGLVRYNPSWPAHTVMAKRVKLTKLVGREV